MRLLFDLYYAQPLNGSKFHGGGEYIKTVLGYLIENYSSEHSITVFYDFNAFLDGWLVKLLEEYQINRVCVRKKNEISKLLKTGNYDVFYTGMPYIYIDVELPMNIYKITTLHGIRGVEKITDLNAIRYSCASDKIKYALKYVFPNYFAKKNRKYYATIFNKFDRIITVSEHSKYSMLVNLPGINKNIRLDVCYAPYKYTYHNVTVPYVTDDKFLLMIGANRWEKNIYRAVIAINNLINKGYLSDYKIIICGDVSKCIKKIIKSDQYILLGYVSNELLASLYSCCDVFVFPSLNEGFGLPPLEAMAYGKTCVVSCICSLPEIYGSAVYWINPYDIQEIENRILMAVENPLKTETVLRRFGIIKDKQDRDLRRICEIILGKMDDA